MSESIIPKSRRERRSLLTNAIKGCDLKLTREIIEADPKILNSGNSHGNNTPLSIALTCGSLDGCHRYREIVN